MKRVSTVSLFIVILLTVLLPSCFDTSTVFAQDNYTILRVDHEVEVMYSGHVAIHDKISISGQLTDDFLIGFPYKYGAYVLEGMVYDEDGNVFPLNLGVQLNKPGFYGASTSFAQSTPQVFTIVFILSNNLLNQDSAGTVTTLDFPAYPSLTKEVAYCNVEIVLPATPTVIEVTKDDGDVSSHSFSKSNLPSFTYSPASATFSIPTGTLQIIDVKELNRHVTISPTGEPQASDNYQIINNSPNKIDSIKIGVPTEAANIIARDQFDRTLTTNILDNNGNTSFVNITFTSSIITGTSTPFKVEYTLPSISSTAPFTLNFDLFPDFDYYVEAIKVTFIPPEGAKLIAPRLSEIDFSTSLIREGFQETFSITKDGVSKINSVVLSETIQVIYDYNPLWLSFRPTMWMWGLAVVGWVVVTIRKRYKTSAPLLIRDSKTSSTLRPERIRAFIEAYNEKSKLDSELKTLETIAQKGKIPRRRYKVQKKTLEVRLDNTSKNIIALKKTFRAAGGNYANLVRQLDVAEAELIEVEINTKRINVRHRKGALPLDAYKKAKADWQRRKEKAEATINGILLRLREENR